MTNLKKEENENRITPHSRKAFFAQFITILSGYIFAIDTGIHAVWPSPSIPYLTSNKSHIIISKAEGAWLASIDSLGAAIGILLLPILLDRIGRRYTILIIGGTKLLTWTVINLSQSYTYLLTARIIAGIGSGGVSSIIPLHIGEIAGKSFRGKLTCFMNVFAHIGGFFVATIGAFLPYKTMNLVMTSVPIIGFFFFPLVKETPYFHLMKGREKNTISTLMKLSGVDNPEIIMVDIERMKAAMTETEKIKKNNIRDFLREEGCRKAFIILVVTCLTYALSGYLPIKAYAQQILTNSGSSFPPEYGTMTLTGIDVFSGLVYSPLVDRWGRKPAFLLSGILSAIALVIVGSFFFIKSVFAIDVSSMNWVPLVFLIMHMTSINIGIATIPYVYSGELFPINVKGIAAMCGWFFVSVTVFGAKMIMQYLNEVMNIYPSFWFFAIFCITGPLIILFLVPEAKGKNLEEILTLMKTKKGQKF